MLTAEDLARYETAARVPVRVAYRGRQVLTNPPPSAVACCSPTRSGCSSAPTGAAGGCGSSRRWSARRRERTGEFTDGLDDPGFLDAFMALPARLDHAHLGARRRRDGLLGDVHQRRGLGPRRARHRRAPQQHDGRAGPLAVRVLHPPAGPPAAVDDGADARAARRRRASWRSAPRAPTASARRSCRWSWASIDRGLDVAAAVQAPRVHFEDGIVYAEPAIDVSALEAAGRTVARFRDLNLFFGGCQAVPRDPAGRLAGAGDPRRGGAVVTAYGRRATAHDELGRERDIGGGAAVERLEQHRPAAGPCRRAARMVVRARRGGGRGVVVADDRQLARHVEAGALARSSAPNASSSDIARRAVGGGSSASSTRAARPQRARVGGPRSPAPRPSRPRRLRVPSRRSRVTR